jgi:hypothetical protein
MHRLEEVKKREQLRKPANATIIAKSHFKISNSIAGRERMLKSKSPMFQ